MKKQASSKAEKKETELTQREQLGEILLLVLTGGILGFIYLWIVVLA